MSFEYYMTTTGMDEQTENSYAWEFYKELYRVGQQNKQEEVNNLQVQIDKLQDEIDALKAKLDDLTKWAEFHIEDYNLSESDSEHDRGWFNAACQVFKTLKGNKNDT